MTEYEDRQFGPALRASAVHARLARLLDGERNRAAVAQARLERLLGDDVPQFAAEE